MADRTGQGEHGAAMTRSRAGGFTLVEILVALTLFAVVGGSLLQLFHAGLGSVRTAGAKAHATLLARSKLTELQAYPDLRPGTLHGDFGDGFRWEAVLSPADVPNLSSPESPQPLALDLRITWGTGTALQSFVVQGLLLSSRDAS